MNSSAKTTAVSLLAAAALGAAVFMGCSVSSGTVDDTDGGTSNTDEDGGTKSDTGTSDTGTGTVCESKQQGDFLNATCQACLEKSCCTQLQTCYNLPGDEAGGKVDCNAYDVCLEDCAGKPDNEVEACNQDCVDTAADGVQAASEAIVDCATNNCATECGAETPDGG